MLQPAAYSWEGDDGATAKKIFSIFFKSTVVCFYFGQNTLYLTLPWSFAFLSTASVLATSLRVVPESEYSEENLAQALQCSSTHACTHAKAYHHLDPKDNTKLIMKMSGIIAFLIIHIDQVTNKMPMWHYLYLPKLQQNNKYPMLYSYMKNNQL